MNGKQSRNAKTFIILMLAALLMVGSLMAASSAAAEQQPGKFGIYVLDTTNDPKPVEGLELVLSEDGLYIPARWATTNQDGYAEFDVRSLSTEYTYYLMKSVDCYPVIFGQTDPGKTAATDPESQEPFRDYSFLCRIKIAQNGDGTRYVSFFDGTDTAELEIPVVEVEHEFTVILDANGGTVSGHELFYLSTDEDIAYYDGMHKKTKADGKKYGVISENVLYDDLAYCIKRDGYELDTGDDEGTGWYTQREGGTAIVENEFGNEAATTLFSDRVTTIYAHWKPNPYTVRFDANTTATVTGTMAPQTFVRDEEKALAENRFVRTDGCTFTGWNTKADGSGISFADQMAVKNLSMKKNGTVTLYAQWRQDGDTLTLDPGIRNGQVTTEAGARPAQGSTVTLAVIPDEGYRIEQVTRTETGGNPQILQAGTDSLYSFVMGSSPTTVSAAFTKIPYQITTGAENGTAVADQQTAGIGDTVNFTVAPDYGYLPGQILATYTDPTGTVQTIPAVQSKDDETKFSLTMPAADVTATAVFTGMSWTISTPTMEYGKVTAAKTARTGETAVLTVSPDFGHALQEIKASYYDRDNHYQAIIPVQDGSDPKQYTFTMPAAPVTVEATFGKPQYSITLVNEHPEYGTITLNKSVAGEGETIRIAIAPKNGCLVEPLSCSTADGQAVLIQEYLGEYSFILPASDVTLTSVFRPKNDCIVQFMVDGEAFNSQTIKEGGKVRKPANPSKDGKAFRGWYDENGKLFMFETVITENRTLTAVWGDTVIPEIRVRVLDSFDLTKGIAGVPVYLCESDIYSVSRTAVTDENGYATINIQGLETEELIMFGYEPDLQWFIPYRYALRGGLTETDSPYHLDTIAGIQLGRDRNGQNYLMSFNWEEPALDEDGTIYTFVASPLFYTVTMDANGGTVFGNETFTYSTDETKSDQGYNTALITRDEEKSSYAVLTEGSLPNAFREGYRFDGWYTAAEGGEPVRETTTKFSLPENTIYAHWTAEPAAHALLISSSEHGSVAATAGGSPAQTVRAGRDVLLTVNPEEGYQLQSLTVLQGSTKIQTTAISAWESTFTMPDGDVAVAAVFGLDISGATVEDLTYTGLKQSVTVRLGGKVLAEGTAYTVLYRKSGAATQAIDAGDYIAEISGVGAYAGTAQAAFTIHRKAVTVTAKNQTVNLNGSIATGAGQATANGLAAWHTLSSVTLRDSGTSEATTQGTITPDNASITANGTDVTANYEITYADGTLTVAKGTPAYTAPAARTGLTYAAGIDQMLVTSGAALGGTIQYAVSTADGHVSDWSTEIPLGQNAGTYSVWYRIAGDNNHEDVAAEEPIAVSIAKAACTAVIRPTATGKTNQEIPLADCVTNTSNNIHFSTNETGCTLNESTGMFTADHAGEFTVNVTVSENINFTGTTGTISVSVTENDSPLTVALSNITYGEAVPEPTCTYNGNPVTATFSYSGITRGGNAYGPAAEAPTEAGSYSATASYTDGGSTFTESASFEISPAAITSENTEVAVSQLIYDGTAKTVQVVSVTRNGENIAESCSFGGTTNYNAGTYLLTVVANPQSNYIGSVTVEYSIEKGTSPAATISAPSTVYGQTLGDVPLPQYWRWTDAGTVLDQVGTVSCEAVYSPDSLDNYTPVKIPVTVNKAPLTITARSRTISYGTVWTGSVDCIGLVNGDTESILRDKLTFTGGYEWRGNAGTYTVTPAMAEGESLDNYDVTFVSGTLTVEPKTVTLTWMNTDLTYNGKAQAPSVIVNGVLAGDSCTATITGAQTYPDYGYTATAVGLSNRNYRLDGETGTAFSILPRPVTVHGIRAENKEYDGNTNARLNMGSAVIEGKLAGDSLYVTAFGSFTDENAGQDKAVRINGMNLSGRDAEYYVLAETGHQTECTADILPKEIENNGLTDITVAWKQNQLSVHAVYNGTALAQNTDYTLANDSTGSKNKISVVFQGNYRGSMVVLEIGSILELPSGLDTIESEAFAGIAADAVYIPKSVQTISPDAFAGSGLKYVYGYEGTAGQHFANARTLCFVAVDDTWSAETILDYCR